MNEVLVGCREWARNEFGSVGVGDERLAKRVVRVAAACATRPGRSLPEALGNWAELKAAYRLVDNEAVTFERLVRPHVERTREACRRGGEHLLVEDTTALSYTGRAVEGLGPVGKDMSTLGILLHSTLALKVERWRSGGDLDVTLEGLFAQHPWVRERTKRKGETKRERLSRSRESERWAAVLKETGGPPEKNRWTFVADREGDIYRAMDDCRHYGVDFVIRAMHPRRLVGQEGSPFDAVGRAAPLGTFTLDVRARPGVPARQATIEVRSVAITLRPPKHGGSGMETMPVTVVEAREIDAPGNVEHVHWVLITTWPVESLEDAMRVVRAYGKRWLIEEYHKALKTGAGIERAQLETRERLEALLGILAVVAVRLLGMKLLCAARPTDELPPDTLGREAFDILEATQGKPRDGWNNRNALIGIAKLGGFLARKGDGLPGWITIWRGWQNLMMMIRGLDILHW